MEIGNQGIYYAESKSGNNDYARTGDELVESVFFEPRDNGINRLCERICIFPFIWFPLRYVHRLAVFQTMYTYVI